MGGFRLGSHRKDRGHLPPAPAEAPGSGRPVAESPVARNRIQPTEFGNMANPLASSARKASKADVWASTGAPAPQEANNYSRPGRATRPNWAPEQAPVAQSGAGQPVKARWQAPAPAPAAPAANRNGHSTIQPPRSSYNPETPQSANGNARTEIDYVEERPAPRSNSGSSHQSALSVALDSQLSDPPARTAPAQEPVNENKSNGRSTQGAWAEGIQDDDWDSEDEDVESVDGDRVPRVLVLDRVGNFSNDLARATVDLDPAPEILRLSRSTQVIDVVEQEEPDVIVVAPEEVTGAGLKRLAEIHRNDPKIVIVLSEGTKPVTSAQTAACGTSDIIPTGTTKARLRSKMMRALQTAEELRQEHLVVEERIVIQEPSFLEQTLEPEPVEEFKPAPFVARPAARNTKLARVFTVASASGGCGKTFYATNFAAYLAKATGGRVLLVDLDLQFGEVAISLHLRPKRTISELVQEEDIAAALSDYVVDHGAGYKVLCAPRDQIAGDKVGPRETTAVLEAARTQFDYIVVDTPPSINETCLAAFDQSQSLVIMATMDLPSLKNLRVFLETLKKLNLPADQVSLVVNKAESGTGIDLKEVEPLYPQGFSAVLPYAKQVSWSINMGMPVLVADPNADISRKLFEGAVKLVAPLPGKQVPWMAPAAAPRRGWFSRLLKGKAK
jgi:MinD-like ATPase involved in chromosome partitioning or flagellar assembly/DNA-binding NarL/FixJ family response regulator